MESRVRTAVLALGRLCDARAICAPEECSCLAVHLLGVDEHELVSESLIESWSELLREVASRGYNKSHLLFVGPSIPSALDGHEEEKNDLEFDGKKLEVRVTVDARCYHDYAREAFVVTAPVLQPPKPAFCILFNAGLWGYESWQPTLRVFLCPGGKLVGTVLVVTSYTLEESEDDYDTMAALLASVEQKSQTRVSLEWAWDCEMNPCAGLEVPRKTQPDGRKYIDSQCWQAVVAVSTQSFELDDYP